MRSVQNMRQSLFRHFLPDRRKWRPRNLAAAAATLLLSASVFSLHRLNQSQDMKAAFRFNNQDIATKNREKAWRQETEPESKYRLQAEYQMKECLSQAWRAQRNNRIILLFAGLREKHSSALPGNVLPQLFNSLVWFKRGNIDEVMAIAFDELTGHMVSKSGYSSCVLDISHEQHASNLGFKGAVFLTRLRVIEQFLSTGLSVVQSDIDAVWTRDAIPFLQKLHGLQGRPAGIVASRGTFPSQIGKKWGGSTLCMGFISAIPERGVVEIFRAARHEGRRYRRRGHRGDDQIGMNTVLDKMNISWTASQENGKVKVPIADELETVNVALLTEDVVKRHCQDFSGHEIVLHCFDRRVGNETFSRHEKMLSRDLWALKVGWWERVEQAVEDSHDLLVAIDKLGHQGHDQRGVLTIQP